MKILVVDDDNLQRVFLQQIITKKLFCKYVEASDGLNGLRMVEEEAPDLVITDVMMPLMDGFEMVEALRSYQKTARIPVVAMSAVGERNHITRLLTLGVSDFLLKPFNSRDFVDRVGAVLNDIRESGERRPRSKSGMNDSSKQTLLLVDNDLNFRSFFQSLYANKFDIVEAESGIEAVNIFLEARPKIVCIGTGLKILAENLVAKKLRALDTTSEASIFLCSERPEEYKEQSILFDGLIRKSFVPKIFFSEFNAVVLGVKSVYESLIDIVNHHLRSEIISAIQQSIGVLTMQESSASVIQHEDLPGEQFEAAIELHHPASNVVMAMSIIGLQKDVEYLFEKAVGFAPDSIESAKDTFGELINTISGRVRQSLDKCGFIMDSIKQHVGLVDAAMPRADEKMQILINCGGAAKFIFSISIRKGNE